MGLRREIERLSERPGFTALAAGWWLVWALLKGFDPTSMLVAGFAAVIFYVGLHNSGW